MEKPAVARQPVEEAILLPTRIADTPNRGFLVDLDRALRGVCLDYGQALNDDLITISDHVRSVAADYSMLDTDRNILADATAGNITVTLPLAADAEPHVFRIKKINAANTVAVARAGADTIDGGAGPVNLAAQWNLLSLISDKGTGWYILHQGAP
jgi:hypothetical protein